MEGPGGTPKALGVVSGDAPEGSGSQPQMAADEGFLNR